MCNTEVVGSALAFHAERQREELQMKKLLFACVLLALVLPVQGTYQVPDQGACLVRVRDLQHSPTPPNPIKVAGRVVSESPLKLNDASGEITVVGTTALLSDFLVVMGDWDGSVLTVTGEVKNYIGPAVTEMVYIPAGSFLMGNNGNEPNSIDSELPQHSVYLSGYWIGKYEVTRGEYRLFMEAGGYSNPAYWSSEGWDWTVAEGRTEPNYWAADQDFGTGTFTQTDSHPVVGVTYYEAEAYCAWAGGHLPAEAQWEKAARWTGSYPNVYPWGNVWDAEKCNNYLDHNSAGGGYGHYQTAPVGSYPSGASPYGLQDMAGNVEEWVAEWCVSYPGSPSPFDLTGTSRVERGGSWLSNAAGSRCACRYCSSPSASWSGIGFRLAR